jgi:hypothetical protein
MNSAAHITEHAILLADLLSQRITIHFEIIARYPGCNRLTTAIVAPSIAQKHTDRAHHQKIRLLSS